MALTDRDGSHTSGNAPQSQLSGVMDGSHAVLECRGLRKRFGELLAVSDVGFVVEKGETYGLLGPNGAGKTTTISMVCGLLAADEGHVFVAGQAISTRSVAARAAIGYVPQELAIYPDLSARENLRFFADLYGLARADARTRVEEVLEVIGLRERAADRAGEYSGGMQRRLNIGIGLLNRPRLLVLDEPTVGVDPQSRNAILESVEQLSGEGMAVLYTTHYMEEAERLCDRIGIIDAGELKAEGTRRELVALVGEHDRVTLGGSGDLGAGVLAARALAPVRVVNSADGVIELVVDDARRLLPELLAAVADAGVAVSSVEVQEPNLEAVFLHLTGKALRD
jgi:ABC-2 type transport system ATP-binding protein